MARRRNKQEVEGKRYRIAWWEKEGQNQGYSGDMSREEAERAKNALKRDRGGKLSVVKIRR